MRIRDAGARLVVAVLAVLVHESDSTSVTSYWGSVPAASSLQRLTLPPGCVCAQDSSLSSCTQFECTCACDLTAGQCDENCCCDSECSASEVARFTAAGACIETSSPSALNQRCIDASAITTINTKNRMVLNAAQNGLANMLCVTTDNNPAKGPFFVDPGSPGAAVFATPAGIAAAAASLAEPYTLSPATTTTATSYAVGEALQTTHSSGGLPVLASASAAECAVRAAGFRSAAPPARCALVAASAWCTLCAGALSWSALSDFRVYTAPSRAASVPVQVAGLFATSSDGTRTPLSAAATAATAAVPGTGAACTCRNAVVEAAYAVNYTSAGTVSGVSVSLVLANVSVASADAPFGYSISSAVSFANPAPSAAASAVFPRLKSGNPGYEPGRAVLAGLLVSATVGGVVKEAVQPMLAPPGESLPGALLLPGRGAALGCVAPGASGGVVVPFLRDTVTECLVPLNATTLAALCVAPGPAAAIEVPTGLRVGQYGNADPLRANQWLAVAVEAATTTGTFDAASNTCSRIVSGVHYDVAVARTGHTGDAQWKVVAARARYSITTGWSLGAKGTPAQLRYVASATFTVMPDGGAAALTPPTPPLLPELPRDIFFPFTSPAPAASGTAVHVAVVAWLALALGVRAA